MATGICKEHQGIKARNISRVYLHSVFVLELAGACRETNVDGGVRSLFGKRLWNLTNGNKMKKVLSILAAVGVLASWAYGESTQQNEFRISGDYLFPGLDDTWDKGYGGTAQFTFWKDSKLGLALSVGAQKWDVNDEIYSHGEYLGSGIAYGAAVGLEGDATMIPLGASVLYKMPLDNSIAFTVDAGLRYVIVNSSVKLVMAEALVDTYGNRITDAYSYDVDIEGGLVGAIGANLDYEVSAGFKIFAGGGYQFDITKGKVEADGTELGENELKGAFIRGGLVWEFPATSAGGGVRSSGISMMQSEERRLAEEKKIDAARKEEEVIAAKERKAEVKKKAAEAKKMEEAQKGEESPAKSGKASSAASASSDKTISSLKQLKMLRDEGLLTEDEYETRRKAMVNKLLDNETKEP